MKTILKLSNLTNMKLFVFLFMTGSSCSHSLMIEFFLIWSCLNNQIVLNFLQDRALILKIVIFMFNCKITTFDCFINPSILTLKHRKVNYLAKNSKVWTIVQGTYHFICVINYPLRLSSCSKGQSIKDKQNNHQL